jgi:hypothetical protein
MRFAAKLLQKLSSARRDGRSSVSARRPKQAVLAWDCLEERTVLSHFGGFHGHVAAFHHPQNHSGSTTTAGASSSTSSSASSSNTALQTAEQTLRTDVQKIESHSGTTVGELTAIRTAFQTLKSDGLSPSSASALTAFENSLVTTFASGTTLSGDATLLSQFEALYTSSPTTQQTTDLAAAYDALAAAVTSSGITSSDISTIDGDWSAVQAAKSSTSTTTFPYFTLVTGQGGPGGGGFGGQGFGGGGCGRD